MKDSTYPQFYYLYDHDIRVGCLSFDSRQELEEVRSIIVLARADCTHDKPGECMRIERTTYREWERMHDPV